MIVIKTFSGSTYELDGNQVRRVNDSHELQKDGEWIDIVDWPLGPPQVGRGMVMELDVPDKRFRTTSPVQSIEEV